MPQPHILKITEIFPSVQGEGLRQGEPTLFVRFSGCNLKCPFCDTKYAWKEGKNYSTGQVMEKIKKLNCRFPAQWICLTGGEPLLQDVAELVKEGKKEGFNVQVETNATLFQDIPVDWYSISPKPDKYFYNPAYRKIAKEVKVVLTKDLNFESLRQLREEFPEKTPLLLQPQSNRKWSMDKGTEILWRAQRTGLRNIKLSVQLHKIYHLR